MTASRSVRALSALSALFALVACGGGGGGGGGTPPPAPPPPAAAPTPAGAVLSVSLSGGASPGIDHLWVTVTGVAMHADATRVYGDGDAGWVVQLLPVPITVDLADPTLANGGGVSLLKQSVAATGTFAQLRLLVASSDPAAPLLGSAAAKGLQFNDQVQVTDAAGVHVVPLELPELPAGIRLLTPFNLSADTTTPLAIEWNGDALVRRAGSGGSVRFTLRDELHLYDQQLLTGLGDADLHIAGSLFDSISGQFDTSHFCSAAGQSGCIHDVVASATSLSADGRVRTAVRSVGVAADGSFLLYPLPSDTFYDVVIHGGNMQTMVVHNVFVDPTGLLKPAPTALGSPATPMVPVVDTTERVVTVGNAVVPGASRVVFGQTVAGDGGATHADVPYAIEAAAADPATGRPLASITLPGGPLRYASFDTSKDGNGASPAFATVDPVEGRAAFTTWAQGTLATSPGAFTVLPAGATTASVANPLPRAGFAAGTLAVTLGGASSNGADHAELVVSNDGGTVAVADVSALLAHGGTTSVAVPSGTSADAPAAALYGVAVRTWSAASELATTRWARTTAPVSLATTTTAAVSLALP